MNTGNMLISFFKYIWTRGWGSRRYHLCQLVKHGSRRSPWLAVLLSWNWVLETGNKNFFLSLSLFLVTGVLSRERCGTIYYSNLCRVLEIPRNTLRCLINGPQLVNFWGFSNPPDPRLLILTIIFPQPSPIVLFLAHT